MFKRILVPLDGSARAEQAIPVAGRIAQASGGTVLLLRVVSTSVEFWPYMSPQSMMAQTVIDADLDEASKYLATASSLEELRGVIVETMALYGPTASTILAVAHSSDADLIVICSHGYAGVTRWIMGSVAEKIARHAAVPVFILREGGPIPVPHVGSARPLRALVPLDGSTRAKTAIEPAAMLASALATSGRGALHLCRVVKPVEMERQTSQVHEMEGVHNLSKAKKYLDSTAQHIREGLVAPAAANLNLAITWSVAGDQDIADALIRTAESGEDAEGAGVFGGCDFIAMATHGYGGIQRWAIGSITERVLSATRLPVLVVRPADMVEKVTTGELSENSMTTA